MIAFENFKNRFCFYFIIIGLLFGVILYDYIDQQLGFKYTDEILAVALCVYTFLLQVYRKKVEKYWMYLFAVFDFYLVYSFYIRSNVPAAILQDFVVQIKPFLGFFCAYSIAPSFTEKQKQVIRLFCFLAFFALFSIAPVMDEIMGHESRFATAAIIVAMLYLFACEFTKSNVLLFIVMLALSLLSTRSKAYGFFVIASGLVLFFFYNKKLTFFFSVRNVIVISCILLGALYFAWTKINFYFIYGSSNITAGEMSQAFARPALYVGSWWVLVDYFPFGSGFGSYATYFSALYYSDVYYEYGINLIHGLTEEDPAFMADTFYPSLAQFGFVGIALFIYFWVFIIHTANKYKDHRDMEKKKLWIIVWLIVLFFLIESVADSTFTQNRGLFLMVLLGLALSELRTCNQKTE